MTLEEKLNETLSTYFYKGDIRFAIKDILTICQEAVDEANKRKEEYRMALREIYNDAQSIIGIIKALDKELKEKL